MKSLQPGTLYICPGGQHLRITPTGRIQLDGTSGRHLTAIWPSIDATMESVCGLRRPTEHWRAILTGMGNDGAQGSEGHQGQAGGLVLAQDGGNGP